MKILGIHIGHNSCACLVVDGKIIADVAEERFTRIKHYSGLPLNAIEYCLKAGGISIVDVDVVAVPARGAYPELNFLLDLTGDRQERPGKKRRMLEYVTRVMKHGTAKPPLYLNHFPIGKDTEIIHVEHHLSHAASAYYTSGTSERQLIATFDGQGDGVSTCLWRGEGGKITPLQKWPSSGSIGWFYSNVTEALGWWHGDGEGKTMGLAPYGNHTKVQGVLDAFYPKFSDGELVEPHDFGRPYFWNEAGAYQWHFDQAYEIRGLIGRYGREDIAAEAQRVLEEQVMEVVFPWLERENTQNLSCAGGVFLNVKLNQRIWDSRKVGLHHIYPNAGDCGLAVGAALYVYHQMDSGQPFEKLEELYWGPEYSNGEIEEILKNRNLSYRYEEDLEEVTAELLAQNKIVAWFQGRMESGPRALGNRSILMSANRPENKDIINARVKFREPFRPFCPSLLDEKQDVYLSNGRGEPFMITSFNTNDGKKDKIPAVVHVDGTMRPQTVEKHINPRYWNVIHKFGELTGEYLVLNTSFNVKGEPIVCHPREAIRCFYDTGLDTLVMGNYILEKR